ncbi:MAG: phage holin family protein [Flavobacteriales bacterium]
MEDKDRFKETYDHLLAYIKERFELLRLQLADRSARGISSVFSKLVLVILLLSGLLFLSVTLSIYLGHLWGAMEWGFAAVGSGYIFLFLFFALLRRPLLQRPLMNGVIKTILKKGDDE